MESSISSVLLVYGPLGIMALVSMFVAVKLYRDRETDRQRHAQEMAVMQERHIAKAETWMSKYHELATSQHAVLEAISRRYDSQTRSDHR